MKNPLQPSTLALAPGSACFVCGSTLTLQVRRGPDGGLDMLHCNHCGSEVPRHTWVKETLAGRYSEQIMAWRRVCMQSQGLLHMLKPLLDEMPEPQHPRWKELRAKPEKVWAAIKEARALEGLSLPNK